MPLAGAPGRLLLRRRPNRAFTGALGAGADTR